MTPKPCSLCARDVTGDDLYVEVADLVVCEQCYDTLPAKRVAFRLATPAIDRPAEALRVVLVAGDAITLNSIGYTR